MVINLSDIAFAMDSVPAVFGITDDGVVVWTSSLCAILALRSLYTVLALSHVSCVRVHGRLMAAPLAMGRSRSTT